MKKSDKKSTKKGWELVLVVKGVQIKTVGGFYLEIAVGMAFWIN